MDKLKNILFKILISLCFASPVIYIIYDKVHKYDAKIDVLKNFTIATRVIDLDNDVLYLYTDGYTDQFGGTKGKKFKCKQLNDLLLKIVGEPLSVQSDISNETLKNWQGDLEQVDDICIVGIKNLV